MKKFLAAEHIEKDHEMLKFLEHAFESSYFKIRELVANDLSKRKDPESLNRKTVYHMGNTHQYPVDFKNCLFFYVLKLLRVRGVSLKFFWALLHRLAANS